MDEENFRQSEVGQGENELQDEQDKDRQITPTSTMTDLRKSHKIEIEGYINYSTPKVDEFNTLGSNDLSTSEFNLLQNDDDQSIVNFLQQVPIFIGNHYVEVIEGVMHLYKENKLTPLGEEAERSDLICMLSISTSKSIHDILQLTAPFNQDILHIQIIRDSSPQQYMALLKFHNQRSADEFYNTFNGTQYNTIEPEVCNLAYVAFVEVASESKNLTDQENKSSDTEAQKKSTLPLTGFTELPSCPVCLERMDESVQGVLTILCKHTFHAKCLDQWYDSTCPVCRYCQTPEFDGDSRCAECGSMSTTQDTLWICLICGHIGCGRYVEGHAHKHFKDTHHTYAMQLGINNRVWDYAGDNYVHRLLANKDGEPVEVKAGGAAAGGGNPIVPDEKIDAVQLEYTYLLTNQLENQRHYYEETMASLEKSKQEQIEELLEANHHLNQENGKLTEQLKNLKKDRQTTEKKITQLNQKLTKVQAELIEERELNKALRENQDQWQKKFVENEKTSAEYKTKTEVEINELKEQLRDIMFYLEAKEKLGQVDDGAVTQEELHNSQVVIQQSPGCSNGKTKHKKGK